MIEQLSGFRSQGKKADFATLAAHANLRFRQQQIVLIQIQNLLGSKPLPTMARSREVRKLDQNRATSSSDKGVIVRFGVLTRNRLRASRGLPMPIGALCQ